MSTKKNKLTAIALVLFSCVLLIVALDRISNHAASPAQRTIEKPRIKGTILTSGLSLPEVSLEDYNHKPFNNDNFKGHWTLLFFGFTNCPKVCPTTMAELNGMMHDLSTKISADHLPQVVMVTVDPSRDTAERMKNYVTSFNPGFVGLRADEKSTADLALALNVSYAKVEMKAMHHEHMGHYTMTHTATIIVIDPTEKVRAYLSYPHQAHEMAHDYLSILGYFHQA